MKKTPGRAGADETPSSLNFDTKFLSPQKLFGSYRCPRRAGEHMKLVPLLDRSGNVKAWADPGSDWIIDLAGKVFAFVSFDGIFTRRGIQIGWWLGDHIRNRYGHVVLSRRNAEIDGIKIPLPKRLPTPPKAHLPTSTQR
jgi:4-fold beta-flower domain-containing protein